MDSEAFDDVVHAVVACPGLDGGGIWFAASTAGLRHSTDCGRQWRDSYASLNPEASIATIALAASPTFQSDHCVLAGVVGGVLHSFDGGETWSVFESPPPSAVFSSLAFSPDFSGDGLVFAGTMEDGVFRSTNRGRDWAAWNFGLLDLAVSDLVVSPALSFDNTLFAATDTGVFRSTNGGRAWRETSFSPDLAPVISLAISPDLAVDRTLFAGTESHGLFCSTNGGDCWDPLGGDAVDGAVNKILLLDQRVSSAAQRLLALVNDGLSLSEDSGKSWVAIDFDCELTAGISAVAVLADVAPELDLLLGLIDGTVVACRGRTRPTVE